jgi:hypothetical protein
MERILCPAVLGFALIWFGTEEAPEWVSHCFVIGAILTELVSFGLAYLPKGGLYLRILVAYLHRFYFTCILSLFIVLTK